MYRDLLISGLAAGLALAGSPAGEQEMTPDPVQAVDSVDLERCAGRRYEVARLPNSFQANCAGETTADYELLNTVTRAEGRARRARQDGPVLKLKSRFAPAFLSRRTRHPAAHRPLGGGSLQ